MRSRNTRKLILLTALLLALLGIESFPFIKMPRSKIFPPSEQ